MITKFFYKFTVIIIFLLITSFLYISGCSDSHKTAVKEQVQYDQGRLKWKIAPDGSKTEYEYNEQGLLAKIIYPKGSVSYGYDANGNRTWMQNKAGRTEYRYDAFDRLTEVVFRYSPEKRISYEYDPWSRISNIKIMDQDRVDYQVKYEYNIIGNLTSIDDGIGRIEYKYHPDKGEVVRHLPNGIKTTSSFSPLGELTALTHRDQQNRVILSYRYKYDPAGKMSRVIEQTSDDLKTTKYDWDSRGYLKGLHLPDGKIIRYEYDSMGNRILEKGLHGTIHYKYDNFGRLIKAENIKYKWNRNGNLSSIFEEGQKTRFIYNERNLLSLVRIPRETIRYGWDGDGNMISRSIGKEITHYLPNPLAPPGFTLAEYDRMGKIQSIYLYGDTLLGQRDRNGQMQYFLEDGFNSIRHITDIKGNIVSQRDFSPFGEHILAKGIVPVNFRMAGERFLPSAKSYLVGSRLYEPKIGRYLTPDPWPNSCLRFDSFNQYAHSRGTINTFMEPKCNQTIKGPSIPPQFEPISSPRFQVKATLEDHGYFGVPILGLPLKRKIEQEAPLQFWGKDVAGNIISPVADASKIGIPAGDLFSLAGPVSSHVGRLVFSGGPILTWEDVEGYSRAILTTIGSGIGTATGTPFGHPIAGGIAGGYVSKGIQGTVANLARFYGTRMDRPYWWWSPMKWMPQAQYIQQLEEQGKRQATLAAEADRRRYKDDERKYYFKPPGGPPGGGGGPGNPFRDPFKAIEANLGGIKLGATAQFTGNLGNIKGVVYDPEKQYLVLVGDGNIDLPSIKPEDLAVALACAFDPRYGDPQFSLDPDDPKNPRGKWLKAVYMPKQIIGRTQFGKTLFEADWLLKQYSFGVTIDDEGRMQERRSSVRGFKSTKDLMFESEDQKQGQERWARFWIISDDMRIKKFGNSIYFDTAKMRVRAKKQVPDPSSPTGLRDVDAEDPISTGFANSFTNLYDEIAKESREFERVRQLAKAVAIAKWIKHENIPFDVNWVNEYANKRIETIERITALSTQWEKKREIPFQSGNQKGIETIIHRLHLFGGVDLTVKPKYISDNGTAQSLKKSVISKLQEKETGPIFNVKSKGETLRAIVFPITPNGQEMWENSPIVNVKGIDYNLNGQGDVIGSIDKFGNTAAYGYDTNVRLKTIEMTSINGWKSFAERKGKGSIWTITNPRGNAISYEYGESGYLREMGVDGQTISTYDYYPERKQVRINHQEHLERISYNKEGFIKEYKVQRKTRDNVSEGQIEELYFTYNDSNNITKIAGTATGQLNISYSKNGSRPLSVETSRGKIDYVYDTNNRIQEIGNSEGLSVKYFYDGEKLGKISFKSGGKQAELVLDEGHVIRARNFFGGTAEYKYNEKRLLNSVTDPQGAKTEYLYDEKNRLHKIILPDGRWIEYQHVEKPSKRKGASSSVERLTTVITHASSEDSKAISAKQKGVEIVKSRLDDIREASRDLRNGLIIDLFVEGKDIVHSKVVDTKGNIHEADAETTTELRRLLRYTSNTKGKIGGTLLTRWQRFYDTNLSHLNKPTSWVSPDGKTVKLKPILIIKSNEVNYKYANIEKVPVLADNFIIFIASKHREAEGVAETTARNLVAKINNIPRLSKENVVFAIRPPRMTKDKLSEWEEAIKNLEEVVGKENVLFNPSKEEFRRMLNNRGKEIIVIELTHTERGIRLKGNEKYTARDVFKGGDLSHIKYLIAGPGTCSLPRLEKGAFAATLRKKGVGIMNTSFGEVSTETALKRLRELIRVLENIDGYDLPTYYLPDIIDQLIDIPKNEKGTTNLGKLDCHEKCLLG